MEKLKYLILGAGPAGLTVANALLQKGETSFLVLEKEDEAGGLCRSAWVDGAPVDIGGGHFLDVRRPAVVEFLFQFMPKQEWARYERDSRIHYGQRYIGHPFEANIWQLPADEQVELLASIARAGCVTGQAEPGSFVDWLQWKLGGRIAECYLLPYNRKMFGEYLEELGTYWLDKLPDVSFEDTLRSCLEKRVYGKQPGHVEFYYPMQFGYGELWRRMANAIGDRIRFHAPVTAVDLNTRVVYCQDGSKIAARKIISTIPWNSVQEWMGLPEALRIGLRKLKHTGIVVRYYEEDFPSRAQWIYEPDTGVDYHRILIRANFCPESRGYWTETNSSRVVWEQDYHGWNYTNEFAYPVNTVEKPEVMKSLLECCRRAGLYGLGRWGEHMHYNSDAVVERALSLAEELLMG